VIRRVIGETPAYVTFDIDCLDPAFAPGTGTPVPGGISTERALEILRELVGCNLIGMDVVEVAPAYDHAEIAALAAATIALELLYVKAAKPADLVAARATGNT
jgi:agmatinase